MTRIRQGRAVRVCTRGGLTVFDLAFQVHVPAVFIGVLVGVAAFAPLALALRPVLRRTNDADITVGLVGIFVSFIMLSIGVVVAYLFAYGSLIPFAVGEVGGFLACLIVVALALIVRHDI